MLDTTHVSDGKVVVSWKILEHNDAAVIQFIVAGPAETSIKPSGTLEDQDAIHILAESSHTIAIIIVTLFYISMAALHARWNYKHPKKPNTLAGKLTLQLLPPLVSVFAAILIYRYLIKLPSMPLPFN